GAGGGRPAGYWRHGSCHSRSHTAAAGRGCGGSVSDRAAVPRRTQSAAWRPRRVTHRGLVTLAPMKASHVEWTAQHTLRMLDQRKLPIEERWVEARTYHEVANAIRDMVVRGAPLIGVVAAFGMAMAAERS